MKTDQDPRAPGCAWLIPYLTVRDASKSLEFYEKAFGFERGSTSPGADGMVIHAEMRYEGAIVLMFSPEGAFGCEMQTPATSGVGSPVNLYVYSRDVDALFARAKAAGAEVLSEPEDMFWGDRIAQFKDPDGHVWTFAINVGEFDPTKMPKG